MAFTPAQRLSAATSLGCVLGKNPDLDLGNVAAGSVLAERADRAGKVAKNCFEQKEVIAARPRNGMTPG